MGSDDFQRRGGRGVMHFLSLTSRGYVHVFHYFNGCYPCFHSNNGWYEHISDDIGLIICHKIYPIHFIFKKVPYIFPYWPSGQYDIDPKAFLLFLPKIFQMFVNLSHKFIAQ